MSAPSLPLLRQRPPQMAAFWNATQTFNASVVGNCTNMQVP